LVLAQLYASEDLSLLDPLGMTVGICVTFLALDPIVQLLVI
jgi:hypothetical protein